MKYPIGIQEFGELRADGYAYVDKTRQIYRLADSGKYYFLSRPRRFGKSLLLSTMRAYFEGRRELFRGLAIEQLEKDWTAYPVLYIDINSGKYTEKGQLYERLNIIMTEQETRFDCPAPAGMSPGFRFERLIKSASQMTGRKAVILIDEYDKPLLETINDKHVQDDNRATLKAFYSVLKSEDAHIKFAFMTGVTKFSHVSIFSDLNNLEDISMQAGYADICGLTEAEIKATFDAEIEALARNNGMSKAEGYLKLREMYDGYHFEYNTEGIYNPFSVLNALKSGKFDSYWFATGTPTFLVKLLESSRAELSDLTSASIKADSLRSLSDIEQNPIPVLYQSGYLTLKSYNARFRSYTLDYPNQEVKEGFLNFLLPSFVNAKAARGNYYIESFVNDVCSGHPEEFLDKLKEFFSSGDYHMVRESELYFQNSMYIIFRLLGLYTEVETATARGRIDITLKTDKYIYILELKLDGSAEQALEQINARGYADKFADDSRKLFLIGVNFSSRTRSISNYKVADN